MTKIFFDKNYYCFLFEVKTDRLKKHHHPNSLEKEKNKVGDIVFADSQKRKHLAIAAGNTVIDYYHELLGRPRMSSSVTSDRITAMTYDSLASTCGIRRLFFFNFKNAQNFLALYAIKII